MKKVLIIAIALMLLTSFAFAANQLSDTTEASITLVGGDLTIDIAGNAADKTIHFPNKTLASVTAAVDNYTNDEAPVVSFADWTGHALGYEISFACDTLKLNDTGSGSQETLLMTYDTTVAPVVAPVAGQGTTLTPITKADASLASAIKVLEAAAGTGMGSYTMTLEPGSFFIDIPHLGQVGTTK
jgi:hypothetical protein